MRSSAAVSSQKANLHRTMNLPATAACRLCRHLADRKHPPKVGE